MDAVLGAKIFGDQSVVTYSAGAKNLSNNEMRHIIKF